MGMTDSDGGGRATHSQMRDPSCTQRIPAGEHGPLTRRDGRPQAALWGHTEGRADVGERACARFSEGAAPGARPRPACFTG